MQVHIDQVSIKCVIVI